MQPAMEIILPATSANLGPAFDTAAIAVRLHLRVRAAEAGDFQISATGRDAAICGQVENNLLLDTYRDILEQHGQTPVPLRIAIDNSIPIGKGLGSSAAARLAGVALAVHFGSLPWTDAAILAEAARRECHADNVAACWLGGFVLVSSSNGSGGGGGVQARRIESRGDWPLLLAITDDPLPTEQARSVLPEHYSRADVVSQVQQAMLLAAGFVEGRPDLVRDALHDRMHEPYRSPLCPLLEPLRSLSGQHGVLGAVLSGSGPSVLVLLDPEAPAFAVCQRLSDFLRERGLRAELLLTDIEKHGACERRSFTPPGVLRQDS